MIQIDRTQLSNQVMHRYGIKSDAKWTPIVNGDECLVWRVDADDESVIVRVSPSWRTVDELQWVHELTLHCSQTIPEVVQPIVAEDGSTLFIHEGYPVTMFPFVEGDSLNTDNDALRNDAARLLAKIHLAASNWAENRPRPSSKDSRPTAIAREQFPEMLRDDDFEAWEASLPDLGLTTVPIHGDYYSRNVLATDTAITGIIDWDEAGINYLMAETGWCVWEFCHNDAGDDLNLDWAQAFVDAYFSEETICLRSEIDHAINFIRLRLRNEAIGALARKARGEGWDKEYTEAEMRAFVTLCELTL